MSLYKYTDNNNAISLSDITGIQGKKGFKGQTGDKGEIGEQGSRGPKGLSDYIKTDITFSSFESCNYYNLSTNSTGSLTLVGHFIHDKPKDISSVRF